jgi:hypothetical protein
MKLLPILYQSIGGARLGFCPMSIEDLAAQQRRDTTERAKRHAKRQDDAVFLRTSGSALIGGDTVSVSSGSNGPFIPGQAAAFLGPGVVDVPSRANKAELGQPSEAIGKIKVLLRINKGDRQSEYWVGGHVKTPILIKKFGLNVSLSQERLENIGTGKDDWIFAYKHDTTIGVIYGATPDRNWEITGPTSQFLYTIGAGFWISQPRFVNPTYKTTIDNNTDDGGLGNWRCDNFGPIGTCQAYSLTGNTESRKVSSTIGSGIDDSLVPLFPGTVNNFNATLTTRKYWDGNFAGGQEPSMPQSWFDQTGLAENCSLSFNWREDRNAIALVETTVSRIRRLNSPAFCYSAYEGALNTLQGQFNIEKDSQSYYRPEQSTRTYQAHLILGIQTGSVEAACKLTKVASSDGAPLRTIPSESFESSAVSLVRSCPIPLAPLVTKQLQISAAGNHATFGNYNAPYFSENYTPLQVSGSAYLYQKSEARGNCIVGDSGEQVSSFTFSQNTYYLLDKIVTFAPGTNLNDLRLKEGAIFTKIDRNPLLEIYDSNFSCPVEVFKDISRNYSLQEILQDKVYKIPFPSTIASIVEGDYYA